MNAVPAEVGRGQLAVGLEHGERDREVEVGAALGQVGRARAGSVIRLVAGQWRPVLRIAIRHRCGASLRDTSARPDHGRARAGPARRRPGRRPGGRSRRRARCVGVAANGISRSPGRARPGPAPSVAAARPPGRPGSPAGVTSWASAQRTPSRWSRLSLAGVTASWGEPCSRLVRVLTSHTTSASRRAAPGRARPRRSASCGRARTSPCSARWRAATCSPYAPRAWLCSAWLRPVVVLVIADLLGKEASRGRPTSALHRQSGCGQRLPGLLVRALAAHGPRATHSTRRSIR